MFRYLYRLFTQRFVDDERGFIAAPSKTKPDFAALHRVIDACERYQSPWGIEGFDWSDCNHCIMGQARKAGAFEGSASIYLEKVVGLQTWQVGKFYAGYGHGTPNAKDKAAVLAYARKLAREWEATAWETETS